MHTMNRLAILLISLPLVGSATPAHAQDADDVLAAEAAALEAYRTNDTAGINRWVADDYTLTDSRGRIVTKAEDLAAARDQAVEFSRFTNVDQQVRLYLDGTVAVVTGRTLVAGVTHDGTAFDQDLPFTDTWILTDSGWRIVASHVSPRRPTPEQE
jgi:ketosteroid isomerase-like protein